MKIDWIKHLVLPLGLVTLLSACQPAPYQRGYVQPAGYAQAYDPCRPSYDGCAAPPRRVQSARSCPPGYRLVRLSYLRYGDSARDCVPETPRRSYRYRAEPNCAPADNVYARSYDRSYRPARYRPTRRRTRDTSCCY
jgi:hypothetical protein